MQWFACMSERISVQWLACMSERISVQWLACMSERISVQWLAAVVSASVCGGSLCRACRLAWPRADATQHHLGPLEANRCMALAADGVHGCQGVSTCPRVSLGMTHSVHCKEIVCLLSLHSGNALKERGECCAPWALFTSKGGSTDVGMPSVFDGALQHPCGSPQE